MGLISAFVRNYAKWPYILHKSYFLANFVKVKKFQNLTIFKKDYFRSQNENLLEKRHDSLISPTSDIVYFWTKLQILGIISKVSQNFGLLEAF